MVQSIITPGNLGLDFDVTGARTGNKINLLLDTYRYKKAINTYQLGGVDSMLAYLQANNSPGSNAMQAFNAVLAYAGGDFETLVLSPWLVSLGLSGTSLVAAINTIRTSALTQAG